MHVQQPAAVPVPNPHALVIQQQQQPQQEQQQHPQQQNQYQQQHPQQPQQNLHQHQQQFPPQQGHQNQQEQHYQQQQHYIQQLQHIQQQQQQQLQPHHQLLAQGQGQPPQPQEPQRHKETIEYPFPPGDVNLEEHPATAIQKRWIIQQMERTNETSYSLARKLNCKSGYIRKLMFRERKNRQYQFRDEAGRPKALDDQSETAILTNLQKRAGELSTADAITLLNQEYQATLTRKDPDSKVKKMPARTRKRYLEKLCPETLQNKKQEVVPPPNLLHPAGLAIPAIQPMLPLSIPGGAGGSSSSSSSQSLSAAVAVVQAVPMEAHNQAAANPYALAQAYAQQVAAVSAESENNDNSGYHSM